ncbi:hypothetical protein TS65_04645 [Aneurinibacillus migulanus]|uniref:Uncharacterized protein n=3 Tax=Aneurinibacillus migulanus TaxID=47500 RepID=A0A0D1WJC8_ANEMI|nr:hypothetical protein TS65_04645 [Aneurinibacillus migulanus]KON96364.1 hypothetical protein AF333_13635 [Aneurinibacillus migulanus]GED12400.1 hypothetical protein AMI01nite_03910 [Aneurinibacillus migulanus]SDI23259.1 hypothetical protein SAMN04487909_102209 [Aneurinibacillus migulanus]
MNGIRRATSLFGNNRGMWQQILPGFRNRRNNRNTMALSLLALGIGATVYGMTRGRNNRGIWQQTTENVMDNSVQATQAGMETAADSTDDILDAIAQATEETIDTTADTVRNVAQSNMY